jgi:outer membrane murein-binding lipoprotein Lpp
MTRGRSRQRIARDADDRDPSAAGHERNRHTSQTLDGHIRRGGSRTARVLTLVAAVALGTGLAGCANDQALTLAREACSHVDRSLTIYRSVEQTPGSARAASEQAQAVAQLRSALPIAATAAGEAPQWQALMTTLSESTRVPESDLVDALEDQCAATSTNGFVPPSSPVTTAP